MKRSVLHQLMLLLLLGPGCGTEVGNPKKPKDEDAPKNSLEDTQATSDLTAALVDETVVALAGESANEAATLALAATDNAALAGRQYDSVCAEGTDGSAVVTQTAIGTSTLEAARGKKTLVTTITGDDNITLKWVLPGQAIKCNRAFTHALIPVRKADNLSLTTTFSHNRVTKTEEAIAALDDMLAEMSLHGIKDCPEADALRNHITSLEAEVERLRSALLKVINEGTDGFAMDGVTNDFLCKAPVETKAMKAERDSLKAQLAEADEVIRPFAEAYERAHENHKTAFVFRADLSRASQYLKGREG